MAPLSVLASMGCRLDFCGPMVPLCRRGTPLDCVVQKTPLPEYGKKIGIWGDRTDREEYEENGGYIGPDLGFYGKHRVRTCSKVTDPRVTTIVRTSANILGMVTASPNVTLEVADLEFVAARTYAAFHGCGATILGRGDEMREAMDAHTEVCQWMEPTC